MKTSLLLSIAFTLLMFGCKEGEPFHLAETSPTKQFLWDLRTKASKQVSDSFNKYRQAYLIQLIYGHTDSANYYKGKSDAFFQCEGIVWPTYYPVEK